MIGLSHGSFRELNKCVDLAIKWAIKEVCSICVFSDFVEIIFQDVFYVLMEEEAVSASLL